MIDDMMDEELVKKAMASVVTGFIITFILGILFISIIGTSKYVSEGGVPLTWIAEIEIMGITEYDYTGFILDLIFWSLLVFSFLIMGKKPQLKIEPETSQDIKPETVREKQLKLVKRIQEERQMEKLLEEAKHKSKEQNKREK